jgi:hypothetical protein
LGAGGLPIGNGSKGRIGYIGNSTLSDAANVAQLSFADIDITLTQKAGATDDPLLGQDVLFMIDQGTQVKLLAFLGTNWAYIETTYQDKRCRAFIPRTALTKE